MTPSARTVPLALALALCTVATAGCATERVAPAAGSRVARADSLRVPVADSGLTWVIDSTPVARIGADESDSTQHFRYLAGARRFANGTIVVATSEGELRWFDAQGRSTGVVVPRGDGPGELRGVGTLTVLPGDTLLVADYSGFRVGLYDSDGTLLDDERIDYERYRGLGSWLECPTWVLPDRARVSCQRDPSIPDTGSNRPSRMMRAGWTSPGAGHLRQLRRLVLASPSLDRAYPLGISAGIEQFGVPNGKDVEFIIHPFYSRPSTAVGGTPTRVAHVLNPAYRVEIWTPAGVLERTIVRAGTRRALSDADRAFAKVEMAKWMNRHDPATRDRLIAEVSHPDSMPAIAGLMYSDDGLLLVRRATATATEPAWVDVFDSAGAWRGGLHMPARTGIAQLTHTHVVLYRQGEDDEPLVEVYRIRR